MKQIAVGGFAVCYSIMTLVVVNHLDIEYPEFLPEDGGNPRISSG